MLVQSLKGLIILSFVRSGSASYSFAGYARIRNGVKETSPPPPPPLFCLSVFISLFSLVLRGIVAADNTIERRHVTHRHHPYNELVPFPVSPCEIEYFNKVPTPTLF